MVMETSYICSIHPIPSTLMWCTPKNTLTHHHFANTEVSALPLMVDCRPGAVAPHELAHANGADHNPQQGPGEMGAHALASPPGVRAPPSTTPVPAYPGVPLNMGAPFGYGCGVKSLVWCAPPPPPPPVNPHVQRSVQPSGADLPMNDIPTLRYYFNLGVECMWAAYGPPRPYPPRDIVQEMQQMSLQERPPHNGHEHRHKPQDKPQGKPGQRPLLGPRFKRGNQDGGQNNHQNKPHNNNNNNMANKGPNNRRNSACEVRVPAPAPEYEGEPPLLALPYVPYPPPLYPVPYYPVEEPGMIGMLGGVGYYEEPEYAPYYAQPYPPPLMHPPPHREHK